MSMMTMMKTTKHKQCEDRHYVYVFLSTYIDVDIDIYTYKEVES